MRRLAAVLLVTLSAYAADWLMSRADPQGTGWQQHGKSISPGNAHELKLLWKKTLDNEARGSNSLTAPTILGPIVTHRGIKELVLVGGSSNNIYAVDADLGRVFWKRHIESAPQPRACDPGLTAAPAFAPPPPGTRIREESDEGASPMRPYYFVAGDGILHSIRPSDGADIAPPQKFVPAGATLSDLKYANGRIFTSTRKGCGGVPEGVWALDTANPSATPVFSAVNDSSISIAPDQTVYASSGDRILTLEPGTLKLRTSIRATGSASIAPIPVTWKGRALLLAAGEGQLVPGQDIRGLATWVDAGGTRWVYAAAARGLRAFRLTEKSTQPILEPAWSAPNIASLLDPVIINGVVFVLAGGDANTHAILYALDAPTGNQLYTSGGAVTSFVRSSGLAVANGHVFFGTQDNTLYCFGFPIEIE